MKFHSIGYTPNWGEWKIGGLSGIQWNWFHWVPFHSISFLQIQTMEFNYLPFHSIPPYTTNPNIAFKYYEKLYLAIKLFRILMVTINVNSSAPLLPRDHLREGGGGDGGGGGGGDGGGGGGGGFGRGTYPLKLTQQQIFPPVLSSGRHCPPSK
ncbi:unnamed protein product [Trifolium pratense]|uniref:Uncharacterized protein n=1 Tax=Trifolium pratense TaxID=57577 RepID=A0ACB0LPA3_TRIPR|nr:unnamed protein product [Trifolium pratense]